MSKTKTPTQTNNPIPSVRVYFTKRDKSLLKQIGKVANTHGMSSSAVAVLAIRLGLPFVKKNLDGLLLDIEVQAEDHERTSALFTSD